jgi:Uma2 family endonuclease
MTITQRRLTLEEFLKLPERKPALEYEDGRITQKVSPKGPHSRLQSKAAELINRQGEPGKHAMAFTELRTTFAQASRVPDVSVYAWHRIPRDARGWIADDFLEPPDVGIEIVSPGQSIPALERRCLRFLGEGVGIMLLVNPRNESIVDFRLGVLPRTLRGSDQIDLGRVLPDFRLTVQELFDFLRLD